MQCKCKADENHQIGRHCVFVLVIFFSCCIKYLMGSEIFVVCYEKKANHFHDTGVIFSEEIYFFLLYSQVVRTFE